MKDDNLRWLCACVLNSTLQVKILIFMDIKKGFSALKPTPSGVNPCGKSLDLGFLFCCSLFSYLARNRWFVYEAFFWIIRVVLHHLLMFLSHSFLSPLLAKQHFIQDESGGVVMRGRVSDELIYIVTSCFSMHRWIYGCLPWRLTFSDQGGYGRTPSRYRYVAFYMHKA